MNAQRVATENSVTFIFSCSECGHEAHASQFRTDDGWTNPRTRVVNLGDPQHACSPASYSPGGSDVLSIEFGARVEQSDSRVDSTARRLLRDVDVADKPDSGPECASGKQ
jgi:hypothetical protein